MEEIKELKDLKELKELKKIPQDRFPRFVTHRLVKSEDINHHGTLFAGRTAEWFVESGFIAATYYIRPQELVCLKIHGLHFSKPVRIGGILRFWSKAVYAGRTSIITYIEAAIRKSHYEAIVDGFITFVHVDENTQAAPHGIILEPKTDEDKKLWAMAKELKRSK
ncbi:MAG: acyl-CoA thioesterase [Proteobacteria bacterium]|nr:acyl-CoA thioesterase [Pseudomonadota bacterium]